MRLTSGRSRPDLLAEVERLRAENAHLRRSLARATARARRVGARDDLEYLFVVTYGRSGSTLLQGILNCIPGYLIRGENRQVLTHLFALHQSALAQRAAQRRQRRRRGEDPSSADPTSSFFGMEAFPHRRSLAAARRLATELLLRPEADTRVTGFKEIRWADEDVRDYVAWLREVFPGARFLVNTRDLDAVARSKWWAEDPEARDTLAATEARLLALAEELGPAAFHVRYDDYVADPAALGPLFAWLGEELDVGRVGEVLAVRHSY